MKKNVCRMVVLISLMVLVLGVGSAMAQYVSLCTANSDTASVTNPTHAIAPGALTSAEARADGWTLGAQAWMYADGYSVGADAQASFTQTFKVTAAGAATINFNYEGRLIIDDNDLSANDTSITYSKFLVQASDTLGNGGADSETLFSPGLGNYSDTFSFTYNFKNEDIGDLFQVTLKLDVAVYAYNLSLPENYGWDLYSSFYNTAKLTDYSGAIAPVPIPGALWLLGSGLLGLIGIRRRQKK